MSISISSKTDYSTLFSSLNSSNSSSSLSSLTSLLSDYSSIKNGSYGKLMKAYYSSTSSDSSESKKTSSTSEVSTTSAKVKALNTVESAADALKDVSDELYTDGENSVFKNGDIDKIDSLVKSYVNNYNTLIDATSDVSDSQVLNRLTTLKGITSSYSDSLSKIGINVGTDYKLTVDTDKLSQSDTDSIKKIFNGTASYGYQLSANSSMIGYAANTAANSQSGYDSTGAYTNSVDAGTLFSSLF